MQHRHWAWERISAGRHKALRRWFVQLNENQKVNVSHWSKSRWLQKAKELWYSCESDWVDSIWNGGQTKELWSKCNIPLFFLNMFVLGISLSTFNSPREVEHPSFIHGMFGVLLLVSFTCNLPTQFDHLNSLGVFGYPNRFFCLLACVTWLVLDKQMVWTLFGCLHLPQPGREETQVTLFGWGLVYQHSQTGHR